MSLLAIEISDQLSAGMRYVTDRLEGPARVELGQAMGAEVQLVVVAHLRGLAATRHDTANRLGASPTNYLAQATDAAAGADVLTAESGAATLTFRHPTIARAFRDIHIAAKGAGALTIPVDKLAYGRRASQFDLYVWRSKTTGSAFLALRQEDRHARPLLMFLLVRSVTQKQDRSLMPSDAEIAAAAVQGVREYLRQTVSTAHLSN